MVLPNYRNNWLREGFTEADLANGGSDRASSTPCACGADADTVKKGLRAHFEAGATHVCLQPVHADGDFAARDRMLAALADTSILTALEQGSDHREHPQGPAHQQQAADEHRCDRKQQQGVCCLSLGRGRWLAHVAPSVQDPVLGSGHLMTWAAGGAPHVRQHGDVCALAPRRSALQSSPG